MLGKLANVLSQFDHTKRQGHSGNICDAATVNISFSSSGRLFSWVSLCVCLWTATQKS